MNYIVIPKEIVKYKSNSKLSDIYTLACIKSTMDYKSGISKYNQKTISEKFDIKERTLRDAINRLENGKLLSIERKIYESKNENVTSKTIRKNYYHFELNPEHYFFIQNDFLKLNLGKEMKGFLILLKAICLNNTNSYISNKRAKNGINISELSNLISMDIKTINKYLTLAKDLDQIAIVDSRIIVKSNYFPIRVKEQGRRLENRKTEIVNTILEICNKYNATMPLVSDKDLSVILAKYHIDEKIIEEQNDIDFIKRYSLRYVLNDRISKVKSLPIQFRMEYILKILNIQKSDNKEKIKHELKL